MIENGCRTRKHRHKDIRKRRKKHFAIVVFFSSMTASSKKTKRNNASRKEWIRLIFQQEAKRVHGQYRNLRLALGLGNREYYFSKQDFKTFLITLGSRRNFRNSAGALVRQLLRSSDWFFVMFFMSMMFTLVLTET